MKTNIRLGWALFLFGLLYSFWLIGNPDVRIANAITDDHPVVISHFWNHPERFQKDLLGTYAKPFALTSLPYWATALLEKSTGLDPRVPSLIFTYAQNALLYVSLFALSLALGLPSVQAFLTTLIAFAASPILWNLAYYPQILHSAYAGHLVVPFLLGAFAFWLTRQFRNASLLLCIAGLIHPSLALQGICVLSLYVLLDRPYAFKKSVLALAAPALLSAGIPLLALKKVPAPLSNEAMIQEMGLSGHFAPWTIESVRNWAFPFFLGMLVFAGLIAWEKRENRPWRTLYLSVLLSTLIFGTVHFLSFQFHWIPLLQLNGLRVTVLHTYVLAVMVFGFLATSLRTPFETFSGGLVLIGNALGLGLLWGPMAAFWVGRRKAFWGWLILLTWICLFIFSGRPMRLSVSPEAAAWLRGALMPGRGTTTAVQALTLVLALALAFLPRVPKIALIPIALIALLFSGYDQGLQTKSGPLYDEWQVQLWMKDHSPVETTFLRDVEHGRGISDRSIVGVLPNGFRPHVYSRNSESVAFKSRFEDILKARNDDPRALTFEDILTLSDRFHADYFITRPGHALPFPMTYANSTFVIYKTKP